MGKKTQVVFSFDTTGSMMEYLVEVRKNLDSVIQRLYNIVDDIEIGIIAHGDYCDGAISYVTKLLDFCSKNDSNSIKTFLDGVTKTTGGDMPECYEFVLQEVREKFSWKPGSHGALIMIGDSIPHEPDENDFGLDWKLEAHRITDKGIRIYAVQCTPASEDDEVPGADDFWQELAQVGGGIHALIPNIKEIVDTLVDICLKEGDKAPLLDSKLLASLKSIDNSKRPVIKNTGDMSRSDATSIPVPPAAAGAAGAAAFTTLPGSQSDPTQTYPKYKYGEGSAFGDDDDGYGAGKPWRDIKLEWSEEEYKKKRDHIASKCPILDESHTYKILLCGAIKAGKSSVINTIFTALRNEIGQIAFNAEDDVSITKKFRVYRLRESVQKRAIRVTLCDTMGFEQQDMVAGPSIRDFEYIMDGHIMDGYEFKPNDSINFSSPHFKKDPGPMDKVHAILVVVDAASAPTMSKEVIEKLKEVTNKANERDIRWAVVMTKIDQVCAEVDSDLKKVFSSQSIANCVEAVNNQFGVIMSNIFPIQNYGAQVQVSLPMNVLALHTLENILRLADNTLECTAGALPIDKEPEPVIELLPAEKAWRRIDRLTEEEVSIMWDQLSEVAPKQVEKLNLCVVGPSGAGKSAFINSAMSEFYQRIVTFAETGKGNQPTTTHYRKHALKIGREGDELSIDLFDTMGFKSSTGGILKDDIVTILDGKAPNAVALNPGVPLTRTDAPVSLNDRMHLLVLVVNGKEFKEYDDALIRQMKDALTVAKDTPRELPRVVVVTHIDEVCNYVADDPSVVYRSQLVKDCLDDVHAKLQVPLVDILPVCNFHNDVEVNWKKSALILQALEHQVERAQDYVATAPDDAPKKKGWFW